MSVNRIRFEKRKNRICDILVVMICFSLVFALSSCGSKESNELSLSQEQVTTPSHDTSANTADYQKGYPFIVLKDKLDTSKPYIKIYDAYGAVTYVQLDDDTASVISKGLGTMEKTDISGSIGTENDYYPENIYLYIGSKLNGEKTDFGNGYSVLSNSESKTCLRDSDKGIDYYADDICKLLISISKQLKVMPYITKDDISSVTKAELKADNVKQLEITDKDTLKKIEDMFRNSERIVNPSTYNIATVLTLTNAEGISVDIELDDSSDICVIGHTYWYDYGPGTDGDNSKDARKELFKLLGITAWPDN